MSGSEGGQAQQCAWPTRRARTVQCLASAGTGSTEAHSFSAAPGFWAAPQQRTVTTAGHRVPQSISAGSGHRFSPRTAIGSPHGRPPALPTAGGP